MPVEFALPDVGEGIDAGEIIEWHVSAGDRVTEDQPLVDVQTDKAIVTIPCPATGVVVELCAAPGETVEVGTRNDMPVNFPFSSGMTSVTAFAAPVSDGTMFSAAARASRGSFAAVSSVRCEFVYECTVVRKPFLIQAFTPAGW